jgi:homospermidine synthase
MAGNDTKHAAFRGKLVILGFGSIGQALLPLLLRHIDLDPKRVTVISKSGARKPITDELGVQHVARPLREDDYESILDGYLEEGDFLLNVSVEVASLSLMRYCWRRGVLYLDTCIEPWPGRSEDASLKPSLRSNYALREEVLAFRLDKRNAATAVITMGANPGLASIFVKQALLDMARDFAIAVEKPACYEDWAALAHRLEVKVIHIAERDTQVSSRRKERGEFVNTWSVNGFIGEGLQPSELGWGTHERHMPADAARHGFGCDAAIYLKRPGAATRVRSWTPLEGPYHGFLITHGESISIADYFTVRDGDQVRYRPTVHYAYHPCDAAVLSIHELAGKTWALQERKRLMVDEISHGIDELGVLLMGHARGAYWYGSQLSIEEARRLVSYNNATSLQVTAAVLAGVVWALENPRAGIVEPDEMDFERCLKIMRPYLGKIVGAYSDWTPLRDRGHLFPEDLDLDDPWQFKNFRVV